MVHRAESKARLSARQRWRGIATIVLIVGFAGPVYIGLPLRSAGLDYYQPARRS